MSWAMRRRLLYILGVAAFFTLLFGTPTVMWYLSIDPTCADGIQNQGETSPDHGGPCLFVDGPTLIPHAVLWARAFKLRDGVYDAVAYVENPNATAGVPSIGYHLKLYDAENVLVTEHHGMVPIMPGGITPVFQGGITTGSRVVAHTIFELDEVPVWLRMKNVATNIVVENKMITDITTSPRLTATARNAAVVALNDITLVAVIFDPAGNAFASSQTAIQRLEPGEEMKIVFTWPQPFGVTVGRIDVIPVHAPVQLTPQEIAALVARQ